MSIMCAYQNCLCVKYPCSSTAFFRLPSDNRRSIWIKNSGNKSLKNISKTAHRFFCENHFRQCDIRTQFNRKILRKHAVPIEHNDLSDSMLFAKGIEHCSKLSRNEDINYKSDTRSNLVVEKLEVDTNISQYNDGEMQELENEKNNEIVEDEFNNSCTVFDFYTQQPCEEDDHYAESYSKEINERNDLDDILFDISSNNQADSSTVSLQYIDDPDEELDTEAEALINNTKPIEDVSLEATTNDSNHTASSSNDYQEDRHFALSLVGYFQRLPKDKRALAKLKILQYLTDLNIGLSSDL